MSFEPVWGAPIAWYLFLAGLGGGAFITSAFLRWKHPEAHGMRFAGHIIAPVVVIIGLFLLMFDAEAGLHNPLRFALLLHNPCSVMTWGVVFLAAFVIIALVTLLLDWNQRIRNRILLPDFIGSRKFSDIIETHDFSPSQTVLMKHHSLSGCIFMQNGSVFHYSIGKTQAQANFMISYQFPCSFLWADFMLA